mmetsp:Transcript_37200/g.89289  ORF Transcript_37200/g.89289 Transcript_37200/m.89289 type:complete len:222 (-) Transcript_37200:413-1078(-)
MPGHPHEADVVGRVELACVDAAVEERDRLAEEGHGHVAQGDADRDGPVGVVDDVRHLAVHREERREHLDGVVGRRARHRAHVEGEGRAEVIDRAHLAEPLRERGALELEKVLLILVVDDLAVVVGVHALGALDGEHGVPGAVDVDLLVDAHLGGLVLHVGRQVLGQVLLQHRAEEIDAEPAQQAEDEHRLGLGRRGDAGAVRLEGVEAVAELDHLLLGQAT